MKKALLKNSVKEIKNTYKRFISILLMAFLGVGFFAGLRATSPDMLRTIDNYYKEQNVYDIQVLSTLGLTSNDVEEISKIENVERVSKSYEIDGKIDIDNKEIITKFITIEDVNKPILLNGNMPQNQDECLVEESFLTSNNKKIGDTITVDIEDTQNDDGEKIKYLKTNELKIVGTVKSPLFIARDRGTSKLGSGKINYYIYISEDNINASDIYTNIYVTVKDAKKYETSSKEYEDYIEKVKENIEQIKEKQEKERHDTLVAKAQEKLDDAEEEYDSKKQDGQTKIDDASKEIEDGKKKIEEAELEIKQNREKADTEFKNAENKLAKAKKEIENNEKTLSDKEQEANTQIENLKGQRNQLQDNLNQINQTLAGTQEQYNLILNALKNASLPEEQRNQYELQKAQLEAGINTLNENKEKVQSGIKQIDDGIEEGTKEIQNAKNQIKQAKNELSKQEKTLSNKKKTTYNQIEKAEKELADKKQELQDGEEELNKNKQEFETQIKDAEKKLSDAKEKISEIENPKWYILDRNSNSGYVSFIQDTKSIDNISKVFPVVFFIVATLISLTSMTRMVEEQRGQIGTLKALGYNKLQIMMKYIIYAGIATIVGSVLGMCVGFIILPEIIWMMYGMMYQMTDKILISFNWKYGGIGLILISICIIGATIYTTLKELVSTPSVLMRPKAPKGGNRVIMEKIPFIWKRLNFSQKVTVRNIFRYKKRFFMTIIGILGCTALILTGFGVKDSVKQIIPNQFENVFIYDMQISLKESLTEEERQEFKNKLAQNNEIKKAVSIYMTSETAVNGNNEEDVQIIVPENQAELDGIINIKDIKNKKQTIKLTENEICLTDKAAQLLGVKAGDTLTLKDVDENEVNIKISNVVENYVSHYVYMTKETYKKLYNKDFKANVVFIQNVKLNDEEQDKLAKEIMNMSEVSGIVNMTSTMKSIDDMMNLLNYVVIVLIVSAGLLAFVVLYNLSNVNISERIRELATIKVLGFYDKEVYDYIARETVILTIIGIALGLVGGYFLNYYLMGTCEINMLRFSKTIKPISYVYASLITIVFTLIVNIATYFALKKIDMIESLKSVE